MSSLRIVQSITWNNPSMNFYLVKGDLRSPVLKNLLLKKEIKKVFDALDTLTNILRKSEFYKHFDVLHKVFEWQMKHFQQRMNPNYEYIDTMHLEDARNLQINKIITDFDNIKVLLTEIYENRSLAMQTLSGCMLLLDIREDLDLKYKLNVEKFAVLKEDYQKRFQVLGFEMKQRSEKRKRILEKNTIETLVLDPISWRYQLNFQYTSSDFIEYELDSKNNDIQKKCDYYSAKGEEDSMASGNARYYLNMEIQYFKEQIAHWSWKYEIDFEKATNDVSILKEHVKALEKRFKDFRERFHWYRSERERMAMEDAAEQEAQRLQSVKSHHSTEKKKKPLRKKKK